MPPIKTAICSFGMSGNLFHAPFIFAHPEFNLYGVWERTKNLAETIYPQIRTFRTLEEMCSDKSIELIIVNTPSATHYNFAKKVIEAGKHLIIEKPFTATSKQASELIQLARNKHLKLSVFHNRRFDSDFKTVKKVLNEGLLGDLIDVEIHYDRYSPFLSDKKHKELSTEAVGSLYDLGSHLIDQAIQLFGFPDSIFANLDILRPGSNVTDYFDLKLFYPSHKVSLKSSYYVKEALPAYILHGTKGSFIKSRADVQETHLKEGKQPDSENWGVESTHDQGLLHFEKEGNSIREHIPTLTGNYMEYFGHIHKAIRMNKEVPVSGEEGMMVIRVIEAAMQSDREKKVIRLN